MFLICIPKLDKEKMLEMENEALRVEVKKLKEVSMSLKLTIVFRVNNSMSSIQNTDIYYALFVV